MADSHVLSGLIRKQAEIAERVETTRTQLLMLVMDLDDIDAAIRDHAFKGEIARVVFETLCQSEGPLTAQQIAQRIMAKRGLNTTDK